MRSVTVQKNELLEVLENNRETHMKDYMEAMAEYRKKAISELSEALKQAKTKNGKIVRHIVAPEPQTYVDSYNTAIRMLEMSVHDEIELSLQDFQRYVEDSWEWKSMFTSNTMVYKKG